MNTKHHFLTLALSIMFAFSFSSCAPPMKFVVEVDSIGSDENVGSKKYILCPTMENVKTTDLRFLEFAKQIEFALSKKDYIQVYNPDVADIAIFVTYGIGNPQEHQYSYSLPVWGQTGVSSSSTSGNVYVFGNTATYSSNTKHTPTYGIVGSNTYQGTYITYFRYLKLDAFDLQKLRSEKQEIQIWSTTVTSTGTSDDLRFVFPYMMATCQKHLGTNTGRKLTITTDQYDYAVDEYQSVK